MARPKQLLLVVARWLLIVELVYLATVNLALQLSLTQDLVNMVRPEKFRVSWDNAWTVYPFRVHAQGINASGQSRSQQWQVTATSASASIRLLPLVLKRVYLRNIEVADIDYRQRPRLKEDKDYSATLPHFPEIQGYDVAPADSSPRKKKRPWKVQIANASATGSHKIWIFNINGGATGSLAADLAIESPGGPFSLDATAFDVTLESAFLNGEEELFHRGTLGGNIGFHPFVPQENKGLKLLPFLKFDVDLALDVERLAFINLFTSNLGDLHVDGSGHVRGSLKYDAGYLLAGTDLTASAGELSVNFADMDADGTGAVRIHTPPSADSPLGLDVDYDSLRVTRAGDADHFLVGDGLGLRLTGSNYVIPDPDLDLNTLLTNEAVIERRKDSTLTLKINEATLLDMSIVNDYLPAETPVTISGGTASLTADVVAGTTAASGGLKLVSTDLGLDVDGQSLSGNLDVDVVIAGGVPLERKLDLSGSLLTLSEVSVVGANEAFDEDYWSAVLELDRVEAVLQRPIQLSSDLRMRVSDTRPLIVVFQNHRKTPKWISKLLAIEDIDGEASVDIDKGLVAIPRAHILSDKAEVAAKIAFTAEGRTGMVYARYEKLDVLLNLLEENPRPEIWKAREKFDNYQPAFQ